MALQLIRLLCPRHPIQLLIDNSGIVDLITRVILAPQDDFSFASGTWAAAFLSLLADGGKLNVPPAWIKRYVGFVGNEMADHYANRGAISLVFNISLPPPSLGTFSQHGIPFFHKLKICEFRHLLPRHGHNNIAVSPSYNYSASSSWFSGLPFEFSSGNLCVNGYELPDNLQECICCSQPHTHVAFSCVALCPTLEHLPQPFVAVCVPPSRLITQQWGQVAQQRRKPTFHSHTGTERHVAFPVTSRARHYQAGLRATAQASADQ